MPRRQTLEAVLGRAGEGTYGTGARPEERRTVDPEVAGSTPVSPAKALGVTVAHLSYKQKVRVRLSEGLPAPIV